MIYATASTWAQDLKHRLSNVPFNIGPMASLIGLVLFAVLTLLGESLRGILLGAFAFISDRM